MKTSSVAGRITQLVIGRLKRDPTYHLEYEYGNRQLFEVIRQRATQLVRGAFLHRKFRTSGWPVFAGRRITIRHGRGIRVGSSAIISDDVILDGLGLHGLTVGDNVTIGRGTTLLTTGVLARPGLGIVIGSRTGIGEYCHLGGQGGIVIGADVLFGPHVRVLSENHEFDRLDRPIRLQGESRMSVKIGDNAWIGAGATILAGITIGDGAVVGAAAVVTRDVPADTVVVGNPARVVRARGSRTRARERKDVRPDLGEGPA